jgi:hypothetical protein
MKNIGRAQNFVFGTSVYLFQFPWPELDNKH